MQTETYPAASGADFLGSRVHRLCLISLFENLLEINPGVYPPGKSRKIAPAETSQANPAWEEPVSFPEWHEILALEPLDAQTRAHYAQAIIVYLGCRKASHERASIAGAKRYLDGGTQRGRPDASARAGLRWFFTAYRRCRGSDRIILQRRDAAI